MILLYFLYNLLKLPEDKLVYKYITSLYNVYIVVIYTYASRLWVQWRLWSRVGQCQPLQHTCMSRSHEWLVTLWWVCSEVLRQTHSFVWTCCSPSVQTCRLARTHDGPHALHSGENNNGNITLYINIHHLGLHSVLQNTHTRAPRPVCHSVQTIGNI